MNSIDIKANALNENIINNYKSSSKRLILFDYDGTLVPFSSHPNYPEADKHAIEQVRKLSLDQKNEVYIISGRERNSLNDKFADLHLTIIAEHGYLIKKPQMPWAKTFQDEEAEAWKPIFIPMLQAYSDKCAGSFLEVKESALVWHYRKANSELANICLQQMREEFGLILRQRTDLLWLDGNKVIEIKLANCHKGRYVKQLLKTNAYDFILAMGDDRTDEDLFKAIPTNGYSVKIGEGETCANFRMKEQFEVRVLLDHLTEI